MVDNAPGERQSPNFGSLPNADTILYQVISQHWAHAEQIRWTLLYNLLVANTILLLAWAAIFASNTRPVEARVALTGLCIGGLLVSLAWIFFGMRANGFTNMYAGLGKEVEESLFAKKGPFQAVENYRGNLKGVTGLVRTNRVVIGVPCLFVLLFLVLGVLSILAVRLPDAPSLAGTVNSSSNVSSERRTPMDTATKLQLWLVIGQFALVLVGAAYAIVTWRMWARLTAQVKSTSNHSLAALSNEHNWRLLTL